jgi:class 3 adenylate cyclase
MQRFPSGRPVADISGFTPLADRLAQRGPAVKSCRACSTPTWQLMAVIATHAGEVITFAGDGLLATTDEDPENPDDSSAAVARDLSRQPQGQWTSLRPTDGSGGQT